MSEATECSHDCSSCSKDCKDRKAADFQVKPNAASKIAKVIAVASGKGGVGKSFVTEMLAVMAARKGLRVGILDADITGPSIPQAFGLTGGTIQTEEGIEPQITSQLGIRVISLNMLVEDPTSPVVWRGPVIAGAVKQFWSDVHWGDLDVMFVDMPPGTGDVPLTVFQSLPIDGVVMVSSPQKLVEMIVTKSVRMVQMMNQRILGLVENMSFVRCPKCGEQLKIFGESRAAELAATHSIPSYACLPTDPQYAVAVDAGAVESLVVPELESFIDQVLG